MAKHIRLVTVMLLLACGSYAFGQATASSGIRGRVVDTTGAAVVGADVNVSNAITGFSRTVKTTQDGSYSVEPIPAGMYTVKTSMSGFAAATADKVQTLVGSRTTQNFELKAGATTEVVEVTSQAPLLDALKTDVSQNITPSEVQELPLLGRDAANLAYLAPGIKAADSYDPTKARMAIISVNGQTGRNLNVTVNGVDNKDNTVGGPVMQLPLEGVQEFVISTQRFSAANGRSEGAAINMITKSGTNVYHGSFYADFRERPFNMEQQLADGGTSQPEYSRQQFGGSIGGRIIKDKLFAFFAIERNREHTSLATQPVPLEELTLAAPIGAQPSATIPTPFFETRYNGRMDWRINNEHSAYISYSSQANDTLNDQSDGTGDLTNGNFTVNHMQAANLTLNSLLSNTLVNQFTFGYQYWNNLIDSKISAPLITFPSAGFGTNTNVPQQSYQQKWQFRDDVTKTWNNHTFKTGVDYLWEPKLGGFFEFSSTLNFNFTKDPTCIFGVGRNAGKAGCGPANIPNWNGFATPGLIDSIGIANGDPSFNLPGGAKQLGLYFQDDWKVTNRLTLNLGVRWDRDFNMVGGSGVDRNATVKELLALNNPITNPYVQRKPEDDNTNFSPRVGFAYDLTGRGNHMIRGGFGMYYGNIFLNIPLFMLQQGNATIFQQSLDVRSGDVVPGTGILLENYRYGVDPLPTIPAPSGVMNPGSVGRLMDPDYKNPVTEQFNIGYAWQLSQKSVFETEYVHSLSLHENKTINIIQRVPTGTTCCTIGSPISDAEWAAAGQPVLNSIRAEKSIGRSLYDGLNFSYRQRMASHFSLNANYTVAWARGWGSGTPGSAGGASFRNYPRNAYAPFASYEFGPTGNDERHHITISGIVDMPWGFQFSPILVYGSARPYNVTNSSNALNTGGGTLNAVVVPKDDPTNYLAFSGDSAGAQNCFYYTQDCTIAKFNPLRGDAFFQMDARLAKNFKIGEKMNLQLHAQAFNLTNRANYGNNFHNDIADATSFGTPAGFINPSSTYTPRSLTGEFGFRFSF